MNIWNKSALDELGAISRGRSRYRPRNSPHLYDGNYPFIQTGDIKAAGLYIRSYSQTYNQAGLEQSKLWQPGTLCITIAANIADTAILGISACFPDSVIGFNPDETKADVKFIKYYFDLFQKVFQQISQGAAQDNLSTEKLLKLKIPTPPLPIQQKIASILSAYDNLIENNLKRIKLLEEMAQITYEEWFVRLKFPGHETTLIDSKTGLPLGWEKTTCFDLMDVLSGGTPKTDLAEYWDGNIKFFTPKDAANCVYTLETEKTITELGLKKCNSKLYPKNTIFITARGTVGKLNLAREAMAMNQSCYALVAKNGLSQLFLYCALQNAIGAFKGAANGGVFDAIVVDTFRYIAIINPNEELTKKFDSIITPIFKQVDNLIQQNQLLKEARDILLPRLMTGMIDVEQLPVAQLDIQYL